MKEILPRKLELLSPARDEATALAAINAGADAVYMGGPSHGARAAATNTVESISRVCEYAHRFRVRVYVTLNTLVYDSEIAAVETLVSDLYKAGVDALIVQDMALLRMKIPPIALHASTQCDTRTPEKARFMQDIGMSQIVLPREMTLDEIRAVAAQVSVPLEAFCHGALCVCYSGDCRASLVCGGRSANRGECAQICRLPYDLIDSDGNVIVAGRHLLSLRDLNRLDSLEEMAQAGVSSFKIEGRLKNIAYVRNVTAAYSDALDALCRAHPDKYVRASAGVSSRTFTPDLDRAFNRGFTSYFLDGLRAGAGQLASMLTPKFTGRKIGTVTSAAGNRVRVRLNVEVNNGDGIGWFDARGRLHGVRVNKVVSADTLITLENVDITPGTELYRNYDIAYERRLQATADARLLTLDMTLRLAPGRVVLDITDPARQLQVSAAVDYEYQSSRTSQDDTRRQVVTRLGGSIYTVGNYSDECGDAFIPRSVLAALRRQALDDLDAAARATYPVALRRDELAGAKVPATELTFHDNVANGKARGFYMSHGAVKIAPAMEIDMPSPSQSVHVMTTRYCLRGELGACLRSSSAGKLPAELFLRPTSGNMQRLLALKCNCDSCTMTVTALPAQK